MVWNLTATWREIVERKPSTCKTNQTSGWSGTDDKGKGKPGTGKGRQDRKQRKGKQQGQKGKTGFLEMKGARRQARNTNRSRIQRVEGLNWDHADNWTDADWWSSDWSTDLWNDPAWERAARKLPLAQPAQEQSNPTIGGSISMSGGLAMCELSVDDERDSKVSKMTGTETCTTIGTIGLRIGIQNDVMPKLRNRFRTS